MIVASSDDEFVLLQQLASGDAAAFKKIYEQYHPIIKTFAFHLTKSNIHADEITQIVFVTIWEKRDQIIPGADFKAYIKKITLNRTINFLKKAHRDKQLQQEIFNQMQTLRDENSTSVFEKELQQVYQSAIHHLPTQKKLIYQLSRNNELTYAEIARKLNLSKSTVKNHMIEAIKIIRTTVSKQLMSVYFLLL